ncbi:MAG TPA: ABC transporter ATP-binding protein [Candidatus Limnocylindrales bacterium]|nr:ABC transporter ATP-binding protein [Candidatus Limnocylindrales bacterium]
MDQVSRRFGELIAVNDVSIEIAPGTIVGLIGPSGSGKTTIVRMLTGTLAPTSGELRVLGERPAQFHRRTRERLGYMPQQFHLYPHLTASENVAFCASLFGLFWWSRVKRVPEVLALAQLSSAKDRLAKDLSGGMLRRLSLACALVHDPDVVFVDEPTAGLDPMLRQTVWNEFRRLRDSGRTLFVTTQNVTDAEHCDRVALLVRGRLVALDTPDALRREVFGGEVIDVRTGGRTDAALVEGVPGVRSVRRSGPGRFMIVTDDAARATPEITGAIAAAGDRVVSAEKVEPSFDDVFMALIERSGLETKDEVA